VRLIASTRKMPIKLLNEPDSSRAFRARQAKPVPDYGTIGTTQRLPPIPRTVATCLGILSPVISVVTREGFLERMFLYWCLRTVAISFMWYMCFQLVPNFMFREGWSGYGVSADFLQADFDGMELRRLAMLDNGCLVLVPQASSIGDQVWWCRGGIVPLVLRGSGSDFEIATTSATPKAAHPQADTRKGSNPSASCMPHPTALPTLGHVAGRVRSFFGTRRYSTGTTSACSGCSKKCISTFGPTGGIVSYGMGS